MKVTDELIRKEGISTSNTELQEKAISLKLDRNININQLTDFLNSKKVISVNERVYKKINNSGRKKLLNSIRIINNDNNYFSNDLDLEIHYTNGNYIKLQQGIELRFYVDMYNTYDLVFNLDFEEIEIVYHFYLQEKE